MSDMMHPFLQGLFSALQTVHFGPHRILLAVSGGADSTALLRGLLELKAPLGIAPHQLAVAHLNHGLRPCAEADAEFVAQLCDQHEVEFYGEKVEAAASPGTASDGIEAWAREVRYRFLKETGGKIGARYLMTAHTLNDQAETVLFRLLRGTGFRGAAGITPVKSLTPDMTLLRPLLEVTRDNVLDYLKCSDQPFVVDPSNASADFTRNRLRNEVIPLLDEIMKRQTSPQLARFAGQMQHWLNWIQEETTNWSKACVTMDSAQQLRIDTRAFRSIPTLFQAEVIRDAWLQQGWPQQKMTEQHWNRCVEWALSATPGEKNVLPTGIEAEVRNAQLWLTRRVEA
jgi:tRNA(Ile)-lysidine synthase